MASESRQAGAENEGVLTFEVTPELVSEVASAISYIEDLEGGSGLASQAAKDALKATLAFLAENRK